MSTALLVSALLVSGATTASANAAPAPPTNVEVEMHPTGADAYTVTWSAVRGATSYTVRVTNYPAVTVTGTRAVIRDADIRQLSRPLARAAVTVEARNGSGVSGQTRVFAPCPRAVFIAARGSGDAGTTNGDRLGTMGRPAYDDIRRRLGLTQAAFAADGLVYPAVPALALTGDSRYANSVRTGVAAAVETSRKYSVASGPGRSACTSTRQILFGYSQGAHAMGDTALLLPRGERDRIWRVHLLADPKIRLGDPSIRYEPRQHRQVGLLLPRAAMPSDLDGRVVHWCSSHDRVCHAGTWGSWDHDTARNATLRTWMSWSIANGLSNAGVGSRHPNLTQPTTPKPN